MRSTSKVAYLYALILILYPFFYIFLRPRPQLRSFFVKGSNTEFNNHNTKNNINIFNPPSNKVNVGKSFFIKDNENWYRIIQFSFWGKEYLNLDFLNNQLNITDINIKRIKNNNYALGKVQEKEIV